MFVAIKGERQISLTSDVQATAFKKSGWDVSEQAVQKGPGPIEQKTPELKALKDEAKALGVSFHANIGYSKLRNKVEEARKTDSSAIEPEDEAKSEAQL